MSCSGTAPASDRTCLDDSSFQPLGAFSSMGCLWRAPISNFAGGTSFRGPPCPAAALRRPQIGPALTIPASSLWARSRAWDASGAPQLVTLPAAHPFVDHHVLQRHCAGLRSDLP